MMIEMRQDGATLEAIGWRFGITAQRVSQLLKRADFDYRTVPGKPWISRGGVPTAKLLLMEMLVDGPATVKELVASTGCKPGAIRAAIEGLRGDDDPSFGQPILITSTQTGRELTWRITAEGRSTLHQMRGEPLS